MQKSAAPRALSPGLVKAPARAKPSSPTRAPSPTTQESDEEVTTFPLVEETPVPSSVSTQPLPARTRNRSSSIRGRVPVQVVTSVPAAPAAPRVTVRERSSNFREDFTASSVPPPNMPRPKIPKPGPAKLKLTSTRQEWLQCALRCQWLPEPLMKQLCEDAKGILMEGKNPVPIMAYQC